MDKLKTGSGKRLRTEALTPTAVPVPYDAAAMPGATVLGVDGQLYVSSILPGETVFTWSRITSQSQNASFYIGEGEPSTDVTGNASPKFQVEIDSASPGAFSYAGMALIAHANSIATASFSICKTRGTQSGDRTIVQQGDRVASYLAQAADGQKFVVIGRLGCFVDGPTGLNQVPGRWDFAVAPLTASTPLVGDNTAYALQAMRLDTNRNLLIGNTTGTERLDVTGNIKASQNLLSSGLLIGITSARTNFNTGLNTGGVNFTPKIQIEGGSDEEASASIVRYGTGASSVPRLVLSRTRSSTPNGNTIVQQDDQVGSILYMGTDGSEFIPGAAISALVDDIPDTFDVPMALQLRTRQKGAGPLGVVGRMRISHDGFIGINTSPGTERLSINGGIQLTESTDSYKVGTNNVVGSRKTGWAAPTGTATRTTFDTGTVTTEQLAERVKGLIDNLISHGLIGP